jgi:tripartite-type tricarboxylate transporter receptor subunit TctC
MTMRPTVRNAAPVLAAALACALPLVAAAQGNYPNRPIRVIVPFGTGSVTDVIARVTMPPLAEALGQTIIVDNRPGGGGNPGTDLGVKAVPDGYTLILSSASTLAASGVR